MHNLGQRNLILNSNPSIPVSPLGNGQRAIQHGNVRIRPNPNSSSSPAPEDSSQPTTMSKTVHVRAVLKIPSMDSVKVLLSCNSIDKTILVPKTWSFEDFRKSVHQEFPFLPNDFRISDSDFTELTNDVFQEIKTSRLETWCMVHSSEKIACKLDKPRYELLRYDVHPNALTQSGNYHFSSSYQAFCEFVDNSIQATTGNQEKKISRTVQLHIFLKEKIAAIFDNGEGMTYDGLKAFATYFLSQSDRGLEKTELDQIPAYLDGFISKFGVGATQAGFYLGGSIKVVTKRDDCPYVTEITISKEKLHQRANDGKPVFEDYRCIRNPGDMSTLETVEEKKCLKELIESECKHQQFTCVVITGLKDQHVEYIKRDMGRQLSRCLAHVYHFYLWGEQGCSGNMRLASSSRSSMGIDNNLSFQKADIHVLIDDGRTSSQVKSIDLREVTDDPETRYQMNAKEWFPFALTLKVPGFSLPQVVQGILMYYPHEAGQESIPRETHEDEDAEPVFECFWQGRLAPLSYVHKLSFCTPPAQRTKKQKDILPDICYRRLKGILFFNRHTPISNNKLKILLDERKDLSSALEDATSERRLPQEFRSWLEKCHKDLDKEVSFEDLLPGQPRGGSSDVFYRSIRVITSNGDQVYSLGDIVKLDTKPTIYGRVMYFVQTNKKNDIDKVVVVRQPEEVYHNQQEEKPLSRIIEIPDSNTLKKVFNTEKQMLPKTVRIFKDYQGDELSSKLTWIAGESRKEYSGFWIKIYNGERPPKPLVSVHNKKIIVKEIVEGPEKVAAIQNDVPIEGERYGFKPFWLSKAGSYVLKYTAFLGDREMCSAKTDIEVKANTGTFVRLDEPTESETPTLALGEASLKFKLHFKDNWGNPTALFPGGDTIKVEVTSANLEIRGVKSSYKANRDGDVEVSGLTLEPNGNGKSQFGREHCIRVNAVDIGYVMFPIRLQAGTPHILKLPPFETSEVQNYDEFPEFSVQVLDKWGQACALPDKKSKLHAECDAFSGGPYLSTVDQGQASFGPIKIKVATGQAPCTKKVKISLVTIETIRRKQVIAENVKELSHFSIKVLPSGFPHRIQICHGVHEEANGNAMNGDKNNNDDRRECLELTAPAGSILKGLHLKAFDESGRFLTINELRKAVPKITTSWSGEVPCKNLPSLPDCPVAQLVASTFVGNITCTCNDVTSHTQIRIRPEEGQPQKWAFSAEGSLDIECGAKKLLSSKLTMQVRDAFGNPTSCPPEIVPLISLEYSRQNSATVSYHGEMIYNASSKEFKFSNDSHISGAPGVLTMTVCDKDGNFSKDTQRIQLKPGQPHHIEVVSLSFETNEQKQEQTLRAVAGCSLAHPIQACVCDRAGNKTSLKTILNVTWQPASAGSPVSKKTREKGEVVFNGNSIQCTAKPDQEVKMKISSSDHKGLQSAVVRVSVESSNRVTDLIIRAEDSNILATSNFPTLKIECQTEDGVRVDAVGHISIGLTPPDGDVIAGSAVYRKPTQNREGIVTYLSLVSKCLDQAGNWSVTCQFTEYREQLKSILLRTEHVTFSTPLKFTVLSGPPKTISVRYPSENAGILTASSTADARGRTILPRSGKTETVELVVLDAHGNVANVTTTVDVSVFWPSGPVPEGVVVPCLENHPVKINVDRGKSRIPRLVLKHRVGNYIGEYLLVFSAQGLEPGCLKFAFSTDEHMQRLQAELAPLKKQLTDKEIESSDTKKRLSKCKLEVNSKLVPVRRLFKSAELRSAEVKAVVLDVKKRLSEINEGERSVRRPTVQRGFPPDRIRQYIKGIVAELAYVSDSDIARLLSWYLQSKMGVCLTTAIDKQRKVYDLGFSAYCESTLLAFSKNGFDGRDGKHLPLEFPQPPREFKSTIQFAINLLEFSSTNGYLRSTLYWSLLSKTMVIENLESAQIYRQHLVQMRHPCPTILTRDGHVIASDGLMDPKRRCPKNLNDLKFTFGSLPPSHRPENRELQESFVYLQDLDKSVEEYDKLSELVKKKDEELKQQRILLTPQITTLERELRKLRATSSQQKEPSESPDKRRRR